MVLFKMYKFIIITFFHAFATCAMKVVHERRNWPLENAIDRQRIQSDTILPMRIGLRQNEKAIANAEEWLMGVSDPDSAKFGQHWTQTEVIEAFQPSSETVNAVAGWLSANDILFTHSANKQWFAFDLTASKAEGLLDAEYFEYRTKKGTFEVSCDQYSVPERLRDHIDYITPGSKHKDVTFRSRRSREYHGMGNTQLVPKDTAEHSVGGKHPPYPLPAKVIHTKAHATATAASSISQSKDLPAHTAPPYPPNDLDHCHHSVSPACIRALYGFDVPNPKSPVSPNNTLGIYENWELAWQHDLNEFWQYYTDIPVGTQPIYESIDGAVTKPEQTRGWTKNYTDGSTPFLVFGTEALFDYQIAYPIIYPQNVTTFQDDDPYWASYEENHYHSDIFNDFLDAIDGSYCTYTAYNITGNSPGIDPHYPDFRKHGWHHPLQCGVYKPAPVISMSYGEEELLFPAAYLKRQCLEFLKLGLQGVSFFASSGDDGVGPCTRHQSRDRIFGPSTPASCPWVTSVGATKIRRDTSPYETDPEKAVSFSGGGFSIIHERPAYQNDAVTNYLTKYPPGIPYFYNGDYRNTTGRYNRNGRGYPDLAAVGRNIAVISSVGYLPASGTSASSPIVASLFNRINEERIRLGKGPVGFVNPTLYKNPQVLNDILVGHNAHSCNRGFYCRPGWDAVSGLGTPNYPKLLDLFLNLP